MLVVVDNFLLDRNITSSPNALDVVNVVPVLLLVEPSGNVKSSTNVPSKFTTLKRPVAELDDVVVSSDDLHSICICDIH